MANSNPKGKDKFGQHETRMNIKGEVGRRDESIVDVYDEKGKPTSPVDYAKMGAVPRDPTEIFERGDIGYFPGLGLAMVMKNNGKTIDVRAPVYEGGRMVMHEEYEINPMKSDKLLRKVADDKGVSDPEKMFQEAARKGDLDETNYPYVMNILTNGGV